MANNVYIAISLDGYIATRDGGLEWLDKIPNPDGGDFGFADFIDKIDALVMGRNTFEKVVSFGQWIYTKPVFVLSNSLNVVPKNLEDKAEKITGDPRSVVEELNRKGYKNLYIDGGKVIQSFLKEDLIDEMIITQVPVLLGDGISLFGNLSNELWFELLETEIFNESLVMRHYKRKR